jgi:predicted permease
MSLFSDLLERARALLFRERQERELEEELRFHVEREAEERRRQGVPPDAARRGALLAFGGVEQTKEVVRDARGVRPLQDLAGDLRFAVRGLRRNPGFTLTAVLVLGLGLGATTAVFSVMDSVVLAELPYPDPDRLVVVAEQNSPTNIWALSTADVLAIREQQQSFEAWGEARRGEAALAGTGTPERIVTGWISAGWYKAAGIPVAKGRGIQAYDESPAAPPVVLVTHALAERALGGADRALERTVTLDGVGHTIVGVLPPGRDDLAGVRAVAFPALKLPLPTRRGPFWLRGLGRLKPGTTLEAAASDLAGVSRRLLPVWSDFRDSVAKLTPIPLREIIVGKADRQVGLFAGAVVLVLLLAVTNVATLILVRVSAREPEVAVRLMLGAGRGRIARLLLTENLILTGAAAVAGLALALLLLEVATAMLPNLPRIQNATLDFRAVGFALAAAVVSGILVSISPIMALSAGGGSALRADTRRSGTGRRTNTLRGVLVMAEFALALPLLVGAGLLLNSFIRLQRVDPGFDPKGIVAVTVSLPRSRYPEIEQVQSFWQRAGQRLTELPGVIASGLTSQVPPDNSGNNDNFNLVDHPVPAGAAEPNAPWYYVTPEYFPTLGIDLLEGRMFTAGDTLPVILVSRSWARRYFPNEDPVGRQLVQGGCYDCPRTTILGVVADIKNLGLAGEQIAVYGPVTQSNGRTMSLVVRTGISPPSAMRELREKVSALDSDLPLVESDLTELIRESLSDPRRWTTILSAFAAAGVALAALGIFGLMSYVVRQRRREIGVRLALGAQPNSVTRLIVARGMRYAAAGSLVGLVVTLALGERVRVLLFQVAPTDPLTIALVATLLLGAGLLACWLPGRRAARILPLEAISSE